MSQSEKSVYYQALKAAGVQFDLHYREYTTEQLKAAYNALPDSDAKPPQEEIDELLSEDETIVEPKYRPAPKLPPELQSVPVKHADPTELPGQRTAGDEREPLRVDPETGFVWYQEEVRKPAFPKPRGRRVLKYDDPGVEVKQAKVGEYVETFEVAGRRTRPSEVKVTLPSYQVGIYKDPRFPFDIHIYNETRGFDLFQVENYFGGPELVPAEVKRMYVDNVLCYDIRTTVQSIERAYRELQLQGKI